MVKAVNVIQGMFIPWRCLSSTSFSKYVSTHYLLNTKWSLPLVTKVLASHQKVTMSSLNLNPSLLMSSSVPQRSRPRFPPASSVPQRVGSRSRRLNLVPSRLQSVPNACMYPSHMANARRLSFGFKYLVSRFPF